MRKRTLAEMGRRMTVRNFKIEYTGSSKLLRRICEKLNAVPILGTGHDDAYYGDQGEQAYQHSLTRGNPHGLTLEDLGLADVLDQLHMLLEATGIRVTWTRHTNDEPITTHEGEEIYFQSISRVHEWN